MYTFCGRAISVAQTLSHYELLEEIGRGGMGVVYRARDTRLDRLVAIKVLPPEKVSDADRKRRFVQEAKAASALNHPNIVTIHEIDEADGVDFIVMEYVEGAPLHERIGRHGLPVAQVLSWAVQIADALSAAHAAGIVHRDIKPGNIVVTTAGHVKVLDFGLAKLAERRGPEDETVTAEAATRAGTMVGTVAYASPEQIEGKPVDARSDVFSFGVVLYEMLTGLRPFQGESRLSTAAAVLRDTPQPVSAVRPDVPADTRRILERCLAKQPEARYASGSGLRDALEEAQARLAARSTGIRATLQRPQMAVAVLLLVIAVSGGIARFAWRNSRTRWARNEALPSALRLSEQMRSHGAWRMVREAERYIPDDPQLRQLAASVAISVTIRTAPPDAEVFVRDYSDPADAWESLGRTPLNHVKIPSGFLRWRITKQGFQTLEAADFHELGDVLQFRLEKPDSAPAGMLRVPADAYQLGGARPIDLPEHWIDKYEVTNRKFKEFVARGGYARREYWKEPFLDNGRTVPWEQAMPRFRDATGRPGPATWELGTFPEGQADFPVAGVSWYEAAAYAEFAGKSLPTVYHWFHAAATGIFSDILRFSNFDRKGLARGGAYQGLGRYGTYDMAGNVKEWCWNEVDGERYLLGGAWSEPSYMFTEFDARRPFDRSPTNGFRCVKYEGSIPAAATGPIPHPYRDYAKEKPVSDAVFETLRSIYSYDKGPLDAHVEFADDSHPHWRQEKITFRTAYGSERMAAYLFLPKNAAPPYETVVYHPGGDALELRSSDNLGSGVIFFEFVIRSGRAVLFPVYQGSFERHIDSSGPNAQRDMSIQGVKDAARSVDYLETRPDIDRQRIAFYGLSWGANRGARICAMESRFKTCVLLAGGLAAGPLPPEVDSLNFAPRAHQPLLMLNGRYDFDQSSEMQAKPMLRLWGAPDTDKKLVIYEAGHVPADLHDIIREILDWLDRYLGPVRTIG